ncbi:hypothetical protein LMH73_015595 [Vibrio splendidus]|nr:hypothetical protein [Vibrio splendidus]MCC4882911.1 hypothetical protein [Vibrio splendidus]
MKFVCRDKKKHYQADLLLKSAEFLCSRLGIDMAMVRDLSIKIQSLPAKTSAKLEVKLPSNTSKTKSIILNKDNSLVFSVFMLCHEFVHLKQVLDGRLILVDSETVQWIDEQGCMETYAIVNVPESEHDALFEKYRAQPWESEAYGLQESLCNEIKSQFKDYQFEVCDGVTIPVF